MSKDKQRKSNKERQRRYREKQKSVTSKTEVGFIGDGSETVEMADCVALPKNYGQPDCECRHCVNNRLSGVKMVINH
jgi:ferredoxin-thioredoxin reductase catalytic subunit